MGRKTHKWSEDEKKKIIDLYWSGKSQAEIAQEMDTTECAIEAIIYRSGATKKQNFWTEDDDNKLRELRLQGLSNTEISKIIHRSTSSIATRVYKIGLKKQKLPWNKEEDAALKEMFFNGERVSEIAEKIGRTKSSVNYRISTLKLQREKPKCLDRPDRFWTPEMDEKLKQLKSMGLSRKEIAENMGLSIGQINYRIDHLKLGKPTPLSSPWTEEDISLLTKMYKDGVSEDVIATTLGRTKSAITTKIYKLDLYDGEPRNRYSTDLTGMKFGWLTAIKRVDDEVTRDGKHYPVWECQCQCGNIITARRSNLLSGNTNSCGCYKYKRECDANKFDKYNLTDYEYGVGMDSNNNFFFFDLENFKRIKDRCWSVTNDNKDRAQVYTRMVVDGDSKIVFMHRFLLGLKDPNIKGDHIHGNQNDNRMCNLRKTTQKINTWNQVRLSKSNTSGYIGVTWSKSMNAWCAEITTNGVSTKIGYYKTKEEASEARKKAELEQRGELCYVNSDKDDGYFNPNTIEYDPSTFKTMEEAEKDYEDLVASGRLTVLEDSCAE